MTATHHYTIGIVWTGNQGSGTSAYTAYTRNHTLNIPGKVSISCSSEPAFRGDPTLHNPEEQFLYALSSCHMLWYLHLCADAGVIVTAYEDHPEASMVVEPGQGRFTHARLNPKVTVSSPEMIDRAKEIHHAAHRECFIANSCNFPVEVLPLIQLG